MFWFSQKLQFNFFSINSYTRKCSVAMFVSVFDFDLLTSSFVCTTTSLFEYFCLQLVAVTICQLSRSANQHLVQPCARVVVVRFDNMAV